MPAGQHCHKDARVASHCQPLAFVLEAIAGLDSFKIGGIHLEDVLLTVRTLWPGGVEQLVKARGCKRTVVRETQGGIILQQAPPQINIEDGNELRRAHIAKMEGAADEFVFTDLRQRRAGRQCWWQKTEPRLGR